MTTETELTPAMRGAPYISAGLHIFPVCWRPGHPDHKRPLPNYPWRRRCTTSMSEWVQDCDEAERLWGIDHVAVAWACGEDGFVLIDLDRHENIPGFFDAFEWATLRYETHRGWHYVAKFPTEFEPGNGVTALRTSVGREAAAGIDIRGKGGYAIVDTPDGQRHMPPEALDQAQPFPRPDLLEAFKDGQVDHVTKAEIKAFSDRCRQHRHPSSLTGIVTMLANFDERWPRTKESRHNMLLGMVTQVAIEAKRGDYPFEDGVRTVHGWWKRVIQDPTRDPQPHEWGDALSWAVGRAKQEPDPPTDETAQDAAPNDPLDGDITSPYIDWIEFWKGGSTDHDWLVEGFWPLGRAMLLHAPAKEGKSELVMWWAVQMATGIDLLTGEMVSEPRKVLYVDYEMTDADVRDRLTDFGIDASLDLSNLLYAMRTDDFTALDTALGGAACLARIDADQPQVIIFDTFSRCVDGDENEADTVRAFFRHTGRPIKQRGISYLRLDHTGKDHAKGARGSSAKNDDVDLIWSLRRNQTGQTLVSKSRVSWVPATLHIDRLDGDRIAYRRSGEMAEMVASTAETEKVYQLAEAGVDPEWSFRQVRDHLIEAGVTPGKNSTLMAAIKSYRAIRARGGFIKRPVENSRGEHDAE